MSTYRFAAILAQAYFWLKVLETPPHPCSPEMDARPAIAEELRRNTKKKYDHSQRHDGASGLSMWTYATAMCVACLGGYDFSLAADWLERKQRRGTQLPEHCTHAEMMVILEDRFLSLEPETIAALDFCKNPKQKASAVARARSFVKEHLLAEWVRKRNVQDGAVVRTAVLVDEFNRSLAVSGGPLMPIDRPPSAFGFKVPQQDRKWAQRWRRRHNGKHGHLGTTEPMTLAEKRAKAAPTILNTAYIFFTVAQQGPTETLGHV